MVRSFAVLETANTMVFQSLTMNLAAAVCDQLEGAGLPARLGKIACGYAVMVPSEYAAHSHKLLMARPRMGEILL